MPKSFFHRRFSGFLALVCLLPAVSACTAEEKETPPVPASVASGSETERLPESERLPQLPDTTFGDYAYRILNVADYARYITADEDTGEGVNDAVHQANMEVGERLGVHFETVSYTEGADTQRVRQAITADEDAFDVAMLHDCSGAAAALNGWFRNIYELPYIDVTAPWWPQFTVEALTLNHKMYQISNYTTYRALYKTSVVFFNRTLAENYHIESPYTLVRQGKWTLDTLSACSRGIYLDTNDSQSADKDDLYGFGFSGGTFCWMENAGVEAYRKVSADSAELEIALDNERTYRLTDKLYNWLCTGDEGIWWHNGNPRADSVKMFAEGRAVFTVQFIGDQLEALQNSDVDYGILPFPKLDETDAAYRGACTDRPLVIPITARNPELSGAVTEAMSYAGYQYILPAYANAALKYRYATDPDSAEMMDIIFANRVLSFSYLALGLGSRYQCYLLENTVGQNQNNAASYIREKRKTEEGILRQLEKFYGESLREKADEPSAEGE